MPVVAHGSCGRALGGGRGRDGQSVGHEPALGWGVVSGLRPPGEGVVGRGARARNWGGEPGCGTRSYRADCGACVCLRVNVWTGVAAGGQSAGLNRR